MKKIYMPLGIAAICGLVPDIYLWETTQRLFTGFFVIVPVSVLLLVIIFRNIGLQSKVAIVSITSIVMIIDMIFGLWLLNVRMGFISDMYGLMYLIGLLPALLVGIFFGLYLSNHLKE
jgi:hypothetical protein